MWVSTLVGFQFDLNALASTTLAPSGSVGRAADSDRPGVECAVGRRRLAVVSGEVNCRVSRACSDGQIERRIVELRL